MDTQLLKRNLLKIDNSESIYALRRAYIVNYGKMYLKEFADKRESIAEDMLKIQKKISSYDTCLNCDPHDNESYLNTYKQQVEEMFAELQSHYSVDVNALNVVQFFTYRNTIEKKFKSSSPVIKQ